MDDLRPADVVNSMIDAHSKRLALSPRGLLRGVLSGTLLGAPTTFAETGTATSGRPLIFPVVILGLELVIGSFAIVPLARLDAGVAARIVSIPVTLSNLAGGFLCTGLALYATYRPGAISAAAQAISAPAQVDTKVLAS